ncbi:DUF6196 family protein [Aquimarina macrocephali]|uniref:DUF6196 family protein n=1 Tax=Aquimarina macrocephali TaxID=666563 RepID=UPI0004671C2C
MYISKESKEETEIRLIRVLKSANFKVYQEPYYFRELPLNNFVMDPNALAIVRDDEIISYIHELRT